MAALSMTPELLNAHSSSATRSGVAHAPTLLYSQDGKYLFQREAHVVRVLNTKNGHVLHECIRAEQPALPNSAASTSDDETANKIHIKNVEATALARHPYNALQLIASYADGKIVVWDFIDEKILQEFDAKAPILWMGASTASPLMLLLVISGSSAVKETTVETTPARATASKTTNKTKDSAAVEDEDAVGVTTHWSVVEFNMKKKRRGRTLLEQTKVPFVAAAMQSYVNETSTSTATMVAPETEAASDFHGDYIVVAAASRLFTLKAQRDLDGGAGMGKAVAVQKLSHVRDVTCVSVHPRVALEFSIGDSLGQIFRFFQGALSNAKMHWHAHAVQCLAYAGSDGHVLLSGGEENVLVSWHLESGRRAYLPRRSAALTGIATRVDPQGAGYAVTLQDNVLFQYNAITREQEWQSVGLARSGERASLSLPWKELVFDPLTHAVPLNGVCSAGVLQFYEPYKDRVLYSVLLTERNQVTKTEKHEQLPQIVAEKVAFSGNGMELVTLHRPHTTTSTSTSTGDEQALRFWKRREDGRSFYVHTAIDAPHGHAAVTSLAYAPAVFGGSASGGDVVVTGDATGEFKVWKKTTIVTAASAATNTPHALPGQQQTSGQNTITNTVSTTVWHCQSVVKFRDTAISSVQFSRDGSLLAVAYGALLTLWDLSTMALRGVLPANGDSNGTEDATKDGSATIQQVVFTGSTSPFVVVKTTTQVQVWNLLTMSLWWRYVVPAHGSFLSSAVSSDSSEAASDALFVVALPVVQNEYVLLTFAPESPVPVKLQRVPFTGGDATAIWTLAVHPSNGDVLLMDHVSNLWRVGEQPLESKRKTATADDSDAMTPLAAMFKQARSEFQSKRQAALAKQQLHNQQRTVVGASADSTAALFDAPAHVLPSMTALYRSFIDKMLPKPQTVAGGQPATTPENEELLHGKKANGRKKANKKRKKTTAAGEESQPHDDKDKDAESSTSSSSSKRVKAMVEKELAGPKQTYSTLLAAFRKTKKTTRSSAKP